MAIVFLLASTRSGTWWDDTLLRIIPPVFRNATYNIDEFGAVANNRTDSRDAVAAAIHQCNIDGGGRVLVPGPGIYFIAGPIHMKGGVELHIAGGATLKFSSVPSDYLKEGLTLTHFEGTELYNYSPLIYGYQLTDVGVTGDGTLDGSGQAGFAKWRDKQKTDQNALRSLGNDSVPVSAVCKRQFGEGHFLRPSFLQFIGARNLLVEGVTLIDSPFWVVHPVYSTNVIVRGITINSPHINNDGVDPESSVDVLIENVDINSGDDCISIKSGRDADAWRVGQSSENIIIRNMTCATGANAVCIGSEMSGGVRRVFVDGGIKVSNAGNVVQFKSNRDRGAFIEDVYIRGIVAEEAKGCISFTNSYHSWRGGNFSTLFKNFTMENIHCVQTKETPISIAGLEQQPIAEVTLRDIAVDNTGGAKPVSASGFIQLVFENVSVNGKVVPVPEIETN